MSWGWMRRSPTGSILGAAFAAILMLLLALPGPSAARAATDQFTIESLDVDYTLSRAEDGTSRLRVVETFTVDFPTSDENHGMRRTIPDVYNGQPLHPELVSITDGEGRPRPAETDSEDDAFSMTSRVSGFVHGREVYVFTYDLENVTWTFEDTGDDEFYWDVNGVDWPESFPEITATVHVDESLVGALTGDAACYVGAYGESTPCDISADGDTFTANAQDVRPYETVSVAIGFAPGTFVLYDTGYFASVWGWLQAVSVLVALGALAWAIVLRTGVLRNAPGRSVIIAEYTPPTGIDALTSAVLLGKSGKAIAAEVLEQAVVGSIRIEEGERGFFGGTKLRAVLVDRARADLDGRKLLEALFGDDAQPGAAYVFESSNDRLASASQKIIAWAGKELRRRGVYRAVPRGTRTWPLIALGIGVAGTAVFGFTAITEYVGEAVPILLILVVGVAAVAAALLLAHRPLSAAGAEMRDHLAGLKEFIAWAEADRIRMLQSPRGAERVAVDTNDPTQMLAIYEPLLPYAVVFGQEKAWAERLATFYDDGRTPGWYVGTAMFNAAAFSSSIGKLSAEASSSSSSSGGSKGGGYAGGGGGGGGGGAV